MSDADEREHLTEWAGRLMADDPTLTAEEADKKAAALIRREQSPFKLVRAASIELKAAIWQVRRFIESNTFNVWYAPPGGLKSFAAIDLSCALPSGVDWMGRKVKPGPVAYIAGEGFGGLRRRVRAWEIVRGVSLDDAPLFFSNTPANLCDAEFFRFVTDEVKAVADLVGPPALIVIDTWSRNIAGDENSSLDSAAAVRALDALRAPYGASILVIHHCGWDKTRTRGSSVLMAAADNVFRLEKQEDDEGVAVMYSDKTKDGKAPDPIAFRLRDVGLGVYDDEGVELTSAATEFLPEYEIKTGRGKKAGEVTPDAARIVATLRDSYPDGTSPLVLSGVLAKSPDAIRKALRRLEEKGRVKQVSRGKYTAIPILDTGHGQYPDKGTSGLWDEGQ